MTAVAAIEPAAELAAIEQEHATAWRDWRELLDRKRTLERERRYLDAAGVEHRFDADDPELKLAELELAGREAELAPRVRDVTARLRAAQVADANRLLVEREPVWLERAGELVTAREAFEDAYVRLLDSGWELAAAVEAEARAARRLVEVASSAAPEDRSGLFPDGETRQRIRMERHYRVPVRVTAAGPEEWRDRPSVALFEGDEHNADPFRPEAWQGVAKLLELGRERGGRILGRVVQERLTNLRGTETNR